MPITRRCAVRQWVKLSINRVCLILSALMALLTTPYLTFADDLIASGEITDNQVYDSPEGIIFDGAILRPTAIVSAISTYKVTLKPGTIVQSGAKLVISIKDNDGLDNHCEMNYFGDLTHSSDEDFDGDGLDNGQECNLGTNPIQNNPDNDGDGLPDAWEVQYFGLDLSNTPDQDADGDGISNWIEFKLGSNPQAVNAEGPGIHYHYDELGRIIKIQRIPSR
jgi:hypothetical protein